VSEVPVSIPLLTIYNCGTNFHRGSGDTVARLWEQTPFGEAFITDGAGSGTFKPNRFGGRANPGGANKIMGLAFGSGVDANVQAALEAIRTLKPRAVNMCGWSRGGVTCTKISCMMAKERALMFIPVNIFAIDPVPGSTGWVNHMWRQIELTPNVRNYYVVFAQHDSRATFAPTYPCVTSATRVTVEIMPGGHSTIAMEKGELPEAARIVHDLAKRFLQLHRTTFRDRTLRTASELINLYAQVQMDFQKYRAKAKPDPGWLKRKLGVSPVRTIKDDKGAEVGKMLIDRVGFFVNEHHRDLFQAKYFSLAQELDKDGKDVFRSGTAGTGWVRDATSLSSNEPQAFEQLGYYLNQIMAL
jgi:hypothetical protein